MKIGVNTVDQFGGTLEAYRSSELTPMSLMDMVKRIHENLEPDVIEINGNVANIAPHLVTEQTLQALGQYQAQTGLGLTVHLPFKVIDISSPSEPVSRASAQYFRQLIARFDQHCQIQHYVLHLTETLDQEVLRSNMPQDMQERLLAMMHDRAKSGLQHILEQCAPQRIAIENLDDYAFPYATAGEFGTSICCDIGHLILQDADLLGVIGRYLPRIVEFHYHDVMTIESADGTAHRKDHVALGLGPLDVPGTLGFFREHNFAGVVMIEVTDYEYAVSSIADVRKVLREL